MSKFRSETRVLLLLLLGVFLVAAVSSAYCQDTNASLEGTVTDPNNAAIAGAKLTLTNLATGFQSNFVSDTNGEFSFHNLTPGKYDLEAEASGFKSSSQKGIELGSFFRFPCVIPACQKQLSCQAAAGANSAC